MNAIPRRGPAGRAATALLSAPVFGLAFWLFGFVVASLAMLLMPALMGYATAGSSSSSRWSRWRCWLVFPYLLNVDLPHGLVGDWLIDRLAARSLSGGPVLDNLILGLTAALQFKQFLFMMAGTVIGLWVGVLPGLGGPVAMAILIPFTFSMDPLSALLMLASISVGAAFGGSITSILLNIPGEASSAATAYDGYPMAQQGKAKVAMGLSAGASMAAAIVGVLILMFASAGGEGGAGLQPGGIFRARHPRPDRRFGRRARLDHQGPGDGRARDRDQPDRGRFDPGIGALHLRLRVPARRHQLRAGHGRPVRDHRTDQHDPGGQPSPRPAAWKDRCGTASGRRSATRSRSSRARRSARSSA